MTTRRDAVGLMMVPVVDMLQICGIENHRPVAYNTEAFEYDGWEMEIKITAKRKIREPEA